MTSSSASTGAAPPDGSFRLGEVVEEARELLDDEDKAIRLKAIHAVVQSSGQYRNLLETGELAERVEALEAQLAAGARPPVVEGGERGDGAAAS